MKNFPYVSADYYSDNFKPHDLEIKKEIINNARGPLHRDEIEFIYIVFGRAKILINGTSFSIESQDLLLLMPYHVYLIETIDQTLEVYRITFSLGLLLLINTNKKVYLEQMNKLDKVLPIKRLSAEENKQVSFICEEVYREKQLKKTGTDALNIATISLLSYIYFKSNSLNNGKFCEENMNWKILQFIQVHHQSQLDITDVSKRIRIEESQIERLLTGLTGANFVENLNRVRIRNATALLQFEELSSNQIGRICGYQTEAHFYQQFKRIRGMTPDRFRRGQSTPPMQAWIRMDAWAIYLFIQENYTKDIRINTIAKALNISEKRINQLLQTAFHKSFKELLNEYRLLIGKSMILSVKKPIKEIAYYVGYNDVATFSRNFRKIYGLSPKQFQCSQLQSIR